MMLQMGIPGGIEFWVFNVVIALIVAYFTYRDAQQRPNVNETLWAVVMGLASLFLSLVGFIVVFAIYYLVVIRD